MALLAYISQQVKFGSRLELECMGNVGLHVDTTAHFSGVGSLVNHLAIIYF